MENPKSQADYYKYYFEHFLSKLSKDERDILLINLKRPALEVRGQMREDVDVQKFITLVCSKAEEEYDKNAAGNANSK